MSYIAAALGNSVSRQVFGTGTDVAVINDSTAVVVAIARDVTTAQAIVAALNGA